MARPVARRSRGRWRRLRGPRRALQACGGAYDVARLMPSSDSLTVYGESLASAAVQMGPLPDSLPGGGTVAPLRTVHVDAVEGGTVVSVVATDGALLRRGDMIATLANPQLQLDVTSRAAAIAGQLGGVSAQRLSLQQSLATEEATLAETSYDLLKAQRELAVRQRLHDQGFESDAGLKTFEDEAHYYAERLALLRAAHARNLPIAQRQSAEIDQTSAGLRNNLQVAQASLQALMLRAPVAGRLTNFLLEPGQTVKQGDPIGQIDSEGEYRLDADIDEFYLGRVASGEHATAQFDGITVDMVVARVKPQVANGQFRAELNFAHSTPAGLRRGEGAECRITLGATRRALFVPNGPWMEGGGGNSAYVLDATGHAADRRAITAGRRTPDQVEILAGLQAGERVVTSSYASFGHFSHIIIQ